MDTKKWIDQVVKQDEIDKYLVDGKDFIDEDEINNKLKTNTDCSKEKVRAIVKKAYDLERLSFDDTATLLNVEDDELWEEMYKAGLEIKKKVYDNRIVFFSPLYCGNVCVNSCKYCGFRVENKAEERKVLTDEEIREETRVMLRNGQKRTIVVFGEHPLTDAEYIANSMKVIYGTKEKTRNGNDTYIRRININAAPMCEADLRMLKDVGIGTYQVFQETYHKPTYAEVHPAGLKANYRWRLYALHRAMDAGIDDVAIGALFGLYDWKFEVMGLLYHAADLERQFKIGPHTISFPRLTPASGSDLSTDSKYLVSDENFKKLVTVLRLAVPYTGLIITARENAEVRDDVVNVGCTQLDASTKIGIGAYKKSEEHEEEDKQQFTIGDNRSLEEVINAMAKAGKISSFCTAGYRCGRTGDKIMGLLKSCTEGKFCKLNAVLTFKEYLDDFASPETQEIGEKLIEQEMKEINQDEFYKTHNLNETLNDYYKRISEGERDLYV